jgi:hypothetical protein
MPSFARKLECLSATAQYPAQNAANDLPADFTTDRAGCAFDELLAS